MYLKLVGFFRRFGKGLRTPKGLLFSLFGLIVFIPWLFSVFLGGSKIPPNLADGFRRYAPVGMLAYFLLSLMTSAGDRLIYFTPAEVAFLFPGPFRPREILGYKLWTVAFGTLFSSAIFGLAFSATGSSYLARLVGFFLALMFFQLFSIAVGLGAATLGALADTARRRSALLLLVALVLLPLFGSGRALLAARLDEIPRILEQAPAIQWASMPFRPFVFAITAERLVPDLLVWSAISFAMVLAATACVFALNATYLEALAASSSRIHARLQQVKRGGSWTAVSARNSGRPRSTLPDFPWMGGAGPTFWRQLQTAVRDPIRVLGAMLLVSLPALLMLFGVDRRPPGTGLFFAVEGMVIWTTMFLTPLIPFDFRGDIDRMEMLKTFPVPAWALGLGQSLTPALILSVPQVAVITLIATRLEGDFGILMIAPWLVLPANLLIIGLENLIFLLFPTRVQGQNPADFSAFGRDILVVLVKMAAIVTTGGLAALAALGVYHLAIPRLDVALATALATSCLLVSGLIPLIALAFERYDVARDTPA
jgi:hypothetical protein